MNFPPKAPPVNLPMRGCAQTPQGAWILALVCALAPGCADGNDDPDVTDTIDARDIDETDEIGIDAVSSDTVDASSIDISIDIGPGAELTPHQMNGCLGDQSLDGVAIDWQMVRNPVIAYPSHAAKDMTVRLVDGTWRMMFSYIADEPFRFRIATIESDDLAEWSPPDDIWDIEAAGGLASPELVQLPDGTYVATFNSHTTDSDGLPRLYARTSADFIDWTDPVVIAREQLELPQLARQIDVAVASTPFGLVAAYKHWQTFELAISPSGNLEGPWEFVGAPDILGIENYQFVHIDGSWRMLATALDRHRPLLLDPASPPETSEDWLAWNSEPHELQIPAQSWNQEETANAAHLCDARELDGYFYLFYAGSNELDTFEGRGHARIGVARSRDLVSWEPAPEE